MKNPNNPFHALPWMQFEESLPAGTVELFHGGSSRASSSMLSPHIPQLLSFDVTGTAENPVIDLAFNMAMRAGTGSIYITDGAAQTVIDRATGLPTMRIVGGTQTHKIAPSDLSFSGTHLLIDAPALQPGHTYAVFIAPDALASVTGQLFAGIRTGDRASFTAPGGSPPDTTGPTLVSIEPDDGGILKTGQNVDVTFTFSEKVLMPAAAFGTPHATFGSFHTDDGGITWHATLRATSPLVDVGSNSLAVNMTLIKDLAGNAGTGTPPTYTYGVDTMVSSHVMPDIYLYDDLGPSSNDLITNGTGDHLIEGTIKDVMGEGQHFRLLINGFLADPDKVTLHLAEGGPAGHLWSYDGPLSEGTNTIRAYIEDEADHTSGVVIQVIVIDNTVPAILSSPHGSTEFNVDNDIIVTFSEEMFWQPSEGSDANVRVVDAHGNETTVPVSLANLSANGLTFTVPAEQHGLATGTEYTISLPSTLTDIAGNRPSGPIHLYTAGVYVDTMAPRAIRAEVMNEPGSYGVGEVIDIRIFMNEDVTLASGATPQLLLNDGAVAVFDKIENSRELVFKYTVAAGDDISVLQIVDDASLAGSVIDAAGNLLASSGIDYSWLKNHHHDSSGSEIEIDTIAPLAILPALDPDSDSGATGDSVTSDATPAFTGGGAEAGSTIEMYEGSTKLGSATVNASGNWVLTSDALLDGPHQLDFYQVDKAGNMSSSTRIAVVIDTVAPEPLGAAPLLEEEYLSDYSDSDGITKDVTPTFSGSGAQANAKIVLMSGLDEIGEGVAGSDGNWRIDTDVLSAGIHWITALQVDQAGNESALSPDTKVDIDTSAPTTVGVSAGRPSLPSDTTSFVVKFSDLLIMDSIGDVTVKRNGSPIFDNGNATWATEYDGTGHAYHVLKLSGLLPGAYDIDFELSSPMNVAGLVATNLLQSDILFEILPPL